MDPDPTLTPFFAPRGIAVVGASHNPTKLGYGLARNLIQSSYPGVVHFVNPKGGSLMGRPLYPDIASVPDPVDLATLLIPAASVPEAIRACGERGIRAVIIGSGGFRETGAAGSALEEECLETAAAFGMRLLGPNSIGLLDTHLPMDATFLPPPVPPPGDVAFLSHSGAICAAVIDWARGQGFGLSRLISLGNQADVNETDLLAPVAADPHTRVLNLYLEGVSDGRRFVAQAAQAARQKPILALKVGRYASGQRAAASHTGALAGQESAFNAAFRRAGVIRADTSEEMFDWARALAWSPPARGRSVAVLTNAGGPGVTAADALEAVGMDLVSLHPETRDALLAFLPPAASLHNPVDMLASASPEQYARSLEILLADPGVSSALVILVPPPMFAAEAVARAIIPGIQQAQKPAVVALMGETLIREAAALFRTARIPEYRFPERAASALAVLAQRAEHLQRVQTRVPPAVEADRPKARSLLDGRRARLRSQASAAEPAADSRVLLAQETANALLEAYGISTLPTALARSGEEAAALARRMGFPVVLKIASPDIAHKSDAGGVLLGLADPAAVSQGFDTILRRVGAARPEAELSGVNVQPMLSQGQEVIVGAVQDPQFGPLVMFGSGGIEVEGLRDVAFALAPLLEEEVDYLLDSTWAGKKLRGYRNLHPADRAAVSSVLERLGHLAADFPELAEIEVNPLRVLPPGEGAYAVDVRIFLNV